MNHRPSRTSDLTWFAFRRGASAGIRHPTSHVRRRRGFTLIETALATVIIGVGVLALVQAQEAFLRSNSWSTQAATANYLANEIRELTRRLPKFDPVNGLYVDSGSVLQGWSPRASDTGPTDFAYVTAFDNLRFASNGTSGWADGDLPGPIDAFGTVIPDIDSSGSVRTNGSGQIVPLQGWTQEVHVVKVDPFNNSVTYAKDATLAPNAGTGFKGLAVDKFPIRVTVIVSYRGPYDSADTEMARVSWIVP
ncbi:MAG TPA: prepilin-type N-terminal cleavage/methylation domain-containing protein [Phycisphaerales bacterium]|nr:prepilin-type N-terminal cleavage/methylation domain-containing protein [Phycisphaerales bacterium]